MIVTFLLSSLPEGTQYDSDSESEPPTGTDSYVQYEYGNYGTRYLVRVLSRLELIEGIRSKNHN